MMSLRRGYGPIAYDKVALAGTPEVRTSIVSLRWQNRSKCWTARTREPT